MALTSLRSAVEMAIVKYFHLGILVSSSVWHIKHWPLLAITFLLPQICLWSWVLMKFLYQQLIECLKPSTACREPWGFLSTVLLQALLFLFSVLLLPGNVLTFLLQTLAQGIFIPDKHQVLLSRFVPKNSQSHRPTTTILFLLWNIYSININQWYAGC